jgi:hypothetical protein
MSRSEAKMIKNSRLIRAEGIEKGQLRTESLVEAGLFQMQCKLARVKEQPRKLITRGEV